MGKVQMILDTLVTPLDLDYSQGGGNYMVAPQPPSILDVPETYRAVCEHTAC